MRIVIIADSVDIQSAGIHMYTINLIRSLESSGEHEIFCIRQGKRNDIKFTKDVLVPKVIPFLEKDPIRIFFTIPRAIRNLKPDIVIEPAHFGPFNLPQKTKSVTIIHDLTPIIHPEWHTKMSSLLQRLFLPSILRRNDLIVTNSEHTLNDLRQVYPFTEKKSVAIYPGVVPFFEVHEQAIIDQKEPFFLTTGTIEPRKNLTTLLDAYELFRKSSNSSIRLVICGGKGWKSNDFYDQLQGHPYKTDIELKGYVTKEELKYFYEHCAGFIFPSHYEGFGFPVAEAMSCGAPCIVSKSSSLTEVGGDAVLYFNPNSAQELADKMEQLTSSSWLQTELIQKGLQQAKKFNWEAFALAFESELLKL